MSDFIPQDFGVEIQVNGIPTGGFFNALKNFLNFELKRAEKDISNVLLKSAREEHIYKHDTRNLRNATKIKGAISDENGLILYVDTKKADYAEAVVFITKNNFIEAAATKHREYIYNRIQQAVDGAVVNFNRLK